MRAVIGAAAGIATGATVWFVKDSGAGICAGALVGITIWFWAWGPVLGGRRG
jgi:hypothetical protein